MRRNQCKSVCVLTKSHLGTLDTNWMPWHPSINPVTFSITLITDSRTNKLTWNTKKKLAAVGRGAQLKEPITKQISRTNWRWEWLSAFPKLPVTSVPQGVLSYSQNSLSSFSLFHPSYAEIKHMQLLKMSVAIVQAIKGFAGVQSKICKSPNFHSVSYSSTKFSSQQIQNSKETGRERNILSQHSLCTFSKLFGSTDKWKIFVLLQWGWKHLRDFSCINSFPPG